MVRAIFACAILSVGLAAAGEAPDRGVRVLVLSQFEPGMPAAVAFTTGIRGGLEPLQGYHVYADFLGAQQNRLPVETRDWLRKKHAALPPDVVIAAGKDALEFLTDPATAPWPGVPVVVGMFLTQLVDRSAPMPPTVTGIRDELPVRETVELALKLLPATRHVVLVGGASPLDRALTDVLRADLAPFAGRLDVTELVGLTTPDLETRLRALPDDSIVLVAAYFKDGAGQLWSGQQYSPRISAAARAPFFTFYSFVMGYGTVGGVLIDFEESGRRVAEMVKRVAAGEAPATIRMQSGGRRAVLDGRQLDRWLIPDARVPASVEVRFREPSAWMRYRWIVVAGLCGFAFQAALIAVLLLERRRRRKAELRFRENLAVVAHLGRVGAIGELAGSFAHEINSPLGAVINNAQAARRFIAAGPDRAPDVSACLDDIVNDAHRAGEVIRRMRAHLRREGLDAVEVSVSAVIRDAVHLIALDASERGVDLSVDVGRDLPVLKGDDVQLVQVVLNLVMNALDAVASLPKDRRRVRVTAEPIEGGVEVRVVDSGPGIPPAIARQVFDPFFTTKSTGLGLGLAISRSVVEAHGGTITLSTPEEGGTAFHVRLPAAAARDVRRATA